MSKKTTYSKKPPKKRKHKRKKRHLFRNIILIVIILICVALIGGMALLSSKYGINPKTILQYREDAIELVQNSTPETFRPNKASIIYSDTEKEIAKLYEEEESTYLSYDEIPKDVINAFVSVEDRTFWENSGIDTKGIVRVLGTYVVSRGQTKHGASTITQQVARDIFLTNEKSLERKLKEIFIAKEITKKYDKELIIEFYCNNCCFANATYGIEDASQTYLGKPASELTLSEAAYLCAIPNRPEYYDPFDDPTTALERRDKILGDMYDCGYITESQLEQALVEEIEVVEPKKSQEEFHNYATTLAVKCATEYLMEYKYDFQFQYSFASEEEYEAYQTEYQTAYDIAKRNLKTGGYQIYTSINLTAMDELQKVMDEGLDWNTKKQDNGVYDLQGGMTVINNSTGKIVAAIGGRTQEETANIYSYNHATQSYQQPGSSIKPLIVYAPALELGYDANSMLVNVSQSAAKGQSAEKILKMSGEKMTLRYAVEKSKNGTVYWLASNIGISTGIHYLEEMEFSKITPNDYNLSSALGGMYHGVTTVEMANAYSTLVNHGVYQKADCLVSILDGNGDEIYSEPSTKQVYSVSAADQMVDILKGVITRGTAASMKWTRASDIEAIGKTGTTNDSRDGWFCGATPYYTISVWIGSSSNNPVSGLSGGNYPAQIWKKAMLVMTDGLPAASFELDVPSQLKYENSSTSSSGEEEEEETEEEPTTEDPTTLPGTTIPGEPSTPSAPGSSDTGTPSTPTTPSVPSDGDATTDTPDQPSGGDTGTGGDGASGGDQSGSTGSGEGDGTISGGVLQ